jgi:MscS family membrane protein
MFSDFLNATLYRNTVEDWLFALAIVAGSIIVSRLFYYLSTKGIKRLFEKSKGRFMYILIDMLEEPIALALVMIGFVWAERRLNLPAAADSSFNKVILFAAILTVTWTVNRLLDDLVSEYLVPFVSRSDSKLDDQLLPIIRKAISIVIWVVGIVVALDNAGYNVGTIVAGLGIGGLAFAFAAQETISNLFGGVTIFIDSPFVIGDRIKINNYDGFVREIGLRTSKLETLDGRRLTIPNSLFSKSIIENVSSEPATRVLETVSVACNQKADVIEKAISTLNAVLKADDGLEEKSLAYLSAFGASSYDVTIVLWIKKGADYSATISRVNLAIIKAFEKAKIGFSLPTRYLVQPKA